MKKFDLVEVIDYLYNVRNYSARIISIKYTDFQKNQYEFEVIFADNNNKDGYKIGVNMDDETIVEL